MNYRYSSNQMTPLVNDVKYHSLNAYNEDQRELIDESVCKFGIYYLCPDTAILSAGIRRLYRHVDMLNKAGFSAAILHMQKGFKPSGMPDVPIEYLNVATLDSDSIIVIPEGLPPIMHALKDHPGRRFVIALNWDYIFKNLPDEMDWRTFNIERVLVISPVIGRMIAWSMGLSVHRIDSGIDHQRYHYDPNLKRPQLSYIKRKGINIEQLKRLLGARNKDFINKFRWVGLDGLSESEYAEEICRSSVFVNTSLAEGHPTSCLEAMAAGAIVAGYDSVCGRDILFGQGRNQNCLLAPAGDYLTLAYVLEPVLSDLLQGKSQRTAAIISNALKAVSGMTLKNERRSLISFWYNICRNHIK